MLQTLIMLHGRPRAGKDTVAAFMEREYGFKVMAFATHLYREVAEAFDVTVEQLASDDWKTRGQTLLTPWACSNKVFAELLASYLRPGQLATSRDVLQLWGTEYRRAADNMYWVRQLAADFVDEIHKGTKHIVISDAREVPEATWGLGRALAGVVANVEVWEIIRPDLTTEREGGNPNHSSNKRYPSSLIDCTITNDGAFPDVLLSRVRPFLQHLK